ncbi:MAG TPA: aldo/keto reductase [Solirubrobacteraceae bacterium]|jgi:aryl-alcohol dehydrogenase-like predicted oxidoreductase|nr:aldo/keto reductase [Solirubrobacteraceae bacterium]
MPTPIADSAADPPIPLGADPPLSRVGLGAWAFGRTGWGEQLDSDSRAAILRSVELRVNWIDTAAVYGDGHSERLIGTTIAQLPDSERPLVFTKGGVCVDSRSGRTFRDLDPASLRRQCERSLRRLGVERIDLYQLHWPIADAKAVESAWATLGAMQSEGKIRWAGVSNFDLALLERCSAERPLDAVQLPMSLLSRSAGEGLLPWIARGGATGLVYSPLESGLLSGGFSEQRLRSLQEDDWRRTRSQFRQPLVARTLDLVERLRPIAGELEISLAELAIAWTLTWPGVAGAIVGARNAAQVDGWIGASNLVLDRATLLKIERALSLSGAGQGPRLPPGKREQ